MAPVKPNVFNGRVGESIAQERKRVSRRIVLLGVGVAPKDLIVRTSVEVDLDVVLIGINLPGGRVGRIILRSGPVGCGYRLELNRFAATELIGSVITLFRKGALPLRGSTNWFAGLSH